MKSKQPFLWRYMRDFFSLFLPKQCNSSQNTIIACRNTWNLFLRFLSDRKGIRLDALEINDISAKIVLEFLDTMEAEKGWKPSTRNQRLSCIRTFFHYVICMEPTMYAYISEIDRIPLKKDVNKSHVMEFISQEGIRELLSTPDTTQKNGMRDQFFMSLMYDIAARDGEMLGLKLEDFNPENYTVYLLGKCSKPRLVPVSKETTALFKRYRKKFHPHNISTEPLFYTIHRHEKTYMSDDNVARFLKKYAAEARKNTRDIPEKIYPHMLRRSRAMHLYRSGMPLALLAEFLGHEDPETTLIYAYADTEMKREAIEKVVGNDSTIPDNAEKGMWEGNDDIIARLCNGY